VSRPRVSPSDALFVEGVGRRRQRAFGREAPFNAVSASDRERVHERVRKEGLALRECKSFGGLRPSLGAAVARSFVLR
jgi:hypothetical protein